MKSLVEATKPLQHVNIVRHLIRENGNFPNNGLLPLLSYEKAFRSPGKEGSEILLEILETNSWTNAWENGIYDYHHYHSTAHEVIVVIQGSATVQFGGTDGIMIPMEVGDVIIIPAGVAHKKINGSKDFACIGAYPAGQVYDMNYGADGERPQSDINIKDLPLPENDPLYGSDGPLNKNWFSQSAQATSVL